MSTPEPATIAGDLLESINALARGGRVVDSSDPRYLEVIRGAAALAKADRSAAEVIRGALFGISGNVEAAMRSFALARSSGLPVAFLNEARAMANLGKLSRAQELVRSLGDPSNGLFSEYADIALLCGAITTLHRFNERATKALQLEPYDGENVAALNTIFERRGLEEQFLGEVLDQAGGVVREAGLLFGKGACPQYDWSETDGSLIVALAGSFPRQLASELTFNLGGKLADVGMQLPDGFVVIFRGDS